MKKFMKRLNLKDESGATVVIVALFMVVLLGFAALAIDGGSLYLEKSRLQKALDAAVLAGAQELHTSQANNVAIDTAEKNGFTIPSVTIGVNSVQSSHQVPVEMTFAKVLGIETVNVGARATAMITPIKRAKGVTPIAVTVDAIKNNETNINCDKKKHSPGNCGFLALNGTGADVLEDGIKNGAEISIHSEFGEIDMEEGTDPPSPGVTVDTETGLKWGKVRTAINYLIDQDVGKTYCNQPETADDSCRRVIFVPIVSTFEGTNGRDTVEVIGIAAYWVEGLQGKVIKGKFLRIVTAGELLESDETIDPNLKDYNLHGVKLVE